jgi:hypothetical protein
MDGCDRLLSRNRIFIDRMSDDLEFAYTLSALAKLVLTAHEVPAWIALIKIGARIVRHGRYVVFQLAEVAVPRALFAEILRRIERLRPRPPPFSA